MAHDASHLTFCFRCLHHSAIEEHRTAGEGKRVDFLLVDDVEGVLELRVLKLLWDGRSELGPNALDVLVHTLVTEQRQLLLDLRRGLLSELHVIRQRVAVSRRRDLGLSRRRDERDADHCRQEGVGISTRGQWRSHGDAWCKGRTKPSRSESASAATQYVTPILADEVTRGDTQRRAS